MTGSLVLSRAVPRRQSARDAELVRLRLPDRPGSLAAVTSHLAEHGVDVLRLAVVDRGPGGAVDDLLLVGPGLEEALASLGSRALVLGRRADVDLGDPALEMATACEAVATARTAPAAYRQLIRAALGLVFAEAGLVFADRGPGVIAVVASSIPGIPVAVESEGGSLVASALFCGESLTADGRIPWAPESIRERLPGGSVAVIPGGGLALALAREDHAPFVAVELDRLAALVRVAVRSIP